MACFHPLSAWQKETGEVVFSERGNISRALTLPCGQCIGCRLERSRQWAIRCIHEASLHDCNSFITLTYDDAHLPADGGLDYGHFQKFMRRLRRKRGAVRFYMCGEYGELYSRPHFHACLFGLDFPDRTLYKSSSCGSDLYCSAELAALWPFGFSSIGEVTFESAAYVARYVMKKVTGVLAKDHYRRVDGDSGEVFSVTPEFTRMSLKPGIGKLWVVKYLADVYEHDYVIVNGVKCKPPRYYDQFLALADPFSAEYMAKIRFDKGTAFAEDSSPERLRTREIVAEARLSTKCRSLE